MLAATNVCTGRVESTNYTRRVLSRFIIEPGYKRGVRKHTTQRKTSRKRQFSKSARGLCTQAIFFSEIVTYLYGIFISLARWTL